MVRTIQGKIVIVFLLLVLFAMQLIGAYLLQSLETFYRGFHEERLSDAAESLAGLFIPEGPGDTLAAATVDRLLAEAVREEAAVIVFDAQSRVVAVRDDDPELVGKIFAVDVAQQSLASGALETHFRPENGRRYVEVAAPISGDEETVFGVVYMQQSLDDVYAILDDVRGIILRATLVVLAAMAVLVFILTRSITGPIQELTRRAEEMAAGDFDQRIAVRSDDEIGQLGQVFNTLAARLKETLQEISSEKRKTEAVVTHMADGLLALDGEGRILLANPAAGRLLGVDPGTVTGRTPEEAFPGLALDQPVRKTLAEGEARSEQLVLPVGETIVRGHFAPLADEEGGARGIVVVLQDITEQQRLERMRREFVVNVSHELRTPLTIIKSYVETLEDQAVEDPDTLRRFLARVHDQTDRIVKLVADLLHMARVESRQADMSLAPVAVASTVARVGLSLQHQLRERGHRLRLQIHGPLPLVLADREVVRRVVLNLLANAIEHNPRGTLIEVLMAVEESSRYPQGAVSVTVQDDGVGMPLADRERVFERFYRVDKARSRRSGGTGLGLAIVKELVERLGGDVTLESEPDTGTVISIRLPVTGPRREAGAGADAGGGGTAEVAATGRESAS